MSIIGNNHSVENFVSGKSVALDATQRLVKVTYKTTKKGDKKDSKCVSIPAVSSLEQVVIDAMQAHIVGMYQSAQDAIIRALVDSGKTSIADDEISTAQVLEYLNAEATGERLKKEDVIEWFNTPDGLADMLTLAFAEKLGLPDNATPEQLKRVEQQVNSYRESFAALAGGKTNYLPEKATKMIKTLETYGDSNDVLVSRFKARLEKMSAVQDDLDAL